MKTKYLSVLACSAALALSITQWKSAIAGGYANPVYSMYNASVVEKEKTQGCDIHKASATADLVLFDDGSWSLTGPVNAVGTWAQTSPKDIWLAPARVSDLLSVVDARATEKCKQPTKSLEPTTLIKKMKLVVTPHRTGTFNMKLKGYDENGKSFSYSYTVKGLVQQ